MREIQWIVLCLLALSLASCARHSAPIASLVIRECPQETYGPAIGLVEAEFRSIGLVATVEAKGAAQGPGSGLVMRSYGLPNVTRSSRDGNTRITTVAVTDRSVRVEVFAVAGMPSGKYEQIARALSSGAHVIGEQCEKELSLTRQP
jgi:hypothetical protein